MATATKKPATKTATTTTRKPAAANAPERNIETAVAYVRQTAERAVDLPVGAALTVVDNVRPLTEAEAREKELKQFRTQVSRELNKLERRGGQARRKAQTRVRGTRNRVERELKQRRRSVETQVKRTRKDAEVTLKQNRRKAETGLKKARTTVEEGVSALV